MILKVYSVRDAKSEIFNTPFFQKTHGEAERNFRSLVNDNKSQVNAYPEDFDLWYLGEYDDNTGLMHPLPTPQHITKAVQMLAQHSGTPDVGEAIKQHLNQVN